eukprot:scaffold3366_cov109-Cylindrotheca_fusiformis.AAC.2
MMKTIARSNMGEERQGRNRGAVSGCLSTKAAGCWLLKNEQSRITVRSQLLQIYSSSASTHSYL